MSDACPRCRGPLDPSTATYTDDGSLICKSCHARSDSATAGKLARQGAARAEASSVVVPLLFLALVGGCLVFAYLLHGWRAAWN